MGEPTVPPGVRVALSVTSGLATALLFPPWDFAGLSWVALVPLLLALRGVGATTGFALGMVWGVVEHWATAYWMLPAISTYYQQPFWFAATFGIVSSLIYRGTFYGLIGLLLARIGNSLSAVRRVLFTAAIWVAVELVRARGPSADPWLLIGYGLEPYDTLRQAAAIGGIHLLSFLVVAANATVTEIIGSSLLDRIRLRPKQLALTVIPAALMLGAGATYGRWRLAEHRETGHAVRTAIVQGNNDYAAQWSPGYEGRNLDDYLNLSRRIPFDTDLIVWPESAVTSFLAREPAQLGRILRLLDSSGSDLIFGAPHFTGPDPAVPQFLNSAFYVTRDGIADRYDKVTLLPFAEYYPLRLGAFLRRRFAAVRAFTPGAAPRPLQTKFGPIAVAICFEAVHPEQVRRRMAGGAVALFNLSNDGWLGAGAGPRQHFAMARMRAVENDTWMLRSTTTGISALIDPRGRVVAELPIGRADVLRTSFVPRSSSTPYQRWGAWWGYACVVLAAGLAITSFVATDEHR